MDEGAGAGNVNASALYRLMAWLSPAFPVGAFSYSSGLEWAVEAGDITDAAALQRWLAVMIGTAAASATRSSSFTPIVRRPPATTRRCARSPSSPRPSRPRRSGSWRPPRRAAPSSTPRARPGRAPALDRLLAVWDGADRLSGRGRVACAGHGIPLEPALHAYLHAVAANLVSAGVRLIPLGQTDGQRVLAALEPVDRRDRGARARDARSTTSAARRSAPTSPACATKPSTRGCSGADER